MTPDGGRSLPRRPARYGPDALEAHGGTLPGPAEITEVAHQTAAILIGTGRAAHDPEVTTRLVSLVDDLGLSTVADLWSARPARSLPGTLWRLYALREWVQRSPEQASREYAAGIRFTDVAHVVAGIPEPPRPEEMQRVADQILAGCLRGRLRGRARAGCGVLLGGRGRPGRARQRPRRRRPHGRERPHPQRRLDADDGRGPAGLRQPVAPGRPRLTRSRGPQPSAAGTHPAASGVRVVCGCRAAAAPGPNISRYERPRAVRRSRSGTHLRPLCAAPPGHGPIESFPCGQRAPPPSPDVRWINGRGPVAERRAARGRDQARR